MQLLINRRELLPGEPLTRQQKVIGEGAGGDREQQFAIDESRQPSAQEPAAIAIDNDGILLIERDRRWAGRRFQRLRPRENLVC